MRMSYATKRKLLGFTFLIPFLLYICLQKQFVEGIALSGTKE